METNWFVEITGWLGAAFLLSAYALNSLNKIKASSTLYQGMNFVACVLLLVNTLYHGAIPSSAINIIWIMIAIISLFRNRKKH